MDTLEEILAYYNPETFASDPRKKRLISKIFRQKEFNEEIVSALSLLSSELLKKDAQTSRLIHSISSNLSAQYSEMDQLRIELAQKDTQIKGLLRELDHDNKLSQNLMRKQLEEVSAKINANADDNETLAKAQNNLRNEQRENAINLSAQFEEVSAKINANADDNETLAQAQNSFKSKQEEIFTKLLTQIGGIEEVSNSNFENLVSLKNAQFNYEGSLSRNALWQQEIQEELTTERSQFLEKLNELKEQIDATRTFLESGSLEKENSLHVIERSIGKLNIEVNELVHTYRESTGLLLNEKDYLAFEDLYRGTTNEINQRLSFYHDPIQNCMKGVDPVTCLIADLGCGRGEWLSLLKSWGYQNVVGIDHNESMHQACLAEGRTTIQTDLFDYLSKQKPNSHQLISAFHVVEHLNNNELNELAKELLRVLKPGGYFLFETPNSANVVVGSSTFHLDPTHEKPLPFELSKFFFQRRGFQIDQSFFLNGFGIAFDLGKSSKQAEMGAFFERWFGIGLDYSILIRKPLK